MKYTYIKHITSGYNQHFQKKSILILDKVLGHFLILFDNAHQGQALFCMSLFSKHIEIFVGTYIYGWQKILKNIMSGYGIYIYWILPIVKIWENIITSDYIIKCPENDGHTYLKYYLLTSNKMSSQNDLTQKSAIH